MDICNGYAFRPSIIPVGLSSHKIVRREMVVQLLTDADSMIVCGNPIQFCLHCD